MHRTLATENIRINRCRENDRSINLDNKYADGEHTVQALLTSWDINAGLIRCCAVVMTLALNSCSTLPEPVASPVRHQVTMTPDATPEKLTPPVIDNRTAAIVAQEPTPVKLSTTARKQDRQSAVPDNAKLSIPLPEPVIVSKVSRTGRLENSRLNEVSGISASRNSPGVLYAINDSGDSATLYALSEKGKHIAQWSIGARNRDWEDLDVVELNSQNYILIGDTGDNLRINEKSTFYLVAEPIPNQMGSDLLSPYMTIDFRYEDGPRNVEAFAVYGRTIYLISKEPLGANGPSASRLYALEIPQAQPIETLIATYLTELPIPRISLESKLAASFAGVDLDHITAMDISSSGRFAYLLTYREVHRIERGDTQAWSKAFQHRGRPVHTHNLGQAEALTIAPGRSIFITSEKPGAPLWSIPLQTAP